MSATKPKRRIKTKVTFPSRRRGPSGEGLLAGDHGRDGPHRGDDDFGVVDDAQFTYVLRTRASARSRDDAPGDRR
jgi:hypothetical protein